jgi:alpha-D-glucose phosphate-specific phosphoglucomutase
MSTSEIKFGTDGWRAVISDTFTFKNVSIVGQAISEWIKNDLKAKKKKVSVGYDTRFMSGDYAQIVACVLAKNNIEVLLSPEPIPTPALSFGVPQNQCVCGIMITASHNPYQFNGIKIKTAQGGGASKDITDKVEAYLYKSEVQAMGFDAALIQKKIVMHDFKTPYISFIKTYIDLSKMKKAEFRVLTDAMHGSGNGLMAEILRGARIDLQLMRADINPYFEGKKPEPVVEFLQGILRRMKKEKFDLGLVLDGDADRIAAVAPGGEFIHPQKILGLLILHLVRNRGRKGGVVKTICGTTMIDKIAGKLGLKLYETPVGFKYISDLMIAEQIVAGGEEAGGMGFQDFVPERDGTLAGLLLLEMMVYQQKDMKKIIRDMEKEFGCYYYQRSDVKLSPGARMSLDAFKATKELLGKKVIDWKDFDGVKLICEDESWLMLRPSGTEPLVRAYSEAKTLNRAKELIAYGDSLLRKI